MYMGYWPFREPKVWSEGILVLTWDPTLVDPDGPIFLIDQMTFVVACPHFLKFKTPSTILFFNGNLISLCFQNMS